MLMLKEGFRVSFTAKRNCLQQLLERQGGAKLEVLWYVNSRAVNLNSKNLVFFAKLKLKLKKYLIEFEFINFYKI